MNASDSRGHTELFKNRRSRTEHLIDLNASNGSGIISLIQDYENPQDADGNNQRL